MMTKTIEELAIKVGLDPITSSQGKPVAWRQTVHVEEGGIKSIKYLYNDEKIMVDDDPLYLGQPSTEALQSELSDFSAKLQKDKAEIIEHYKYLKNALICIYDAQYSGKNRNIISTVDMANLAKEVLAIPKPKCMENE